MTVAFSDYETRAREFFADCDFQEGLNIVEELSQLRRQDKYRVGLVGGFSRGKTHLLNTLLSTTIFPEKTTPTTTILTEVSYGEPNLTLVSSSGETEIPLTEESLDRFTADGPQADMPGMLSVRLSDRECQVYCVNSVWR